MAKLMVACNYELADTIKGNPFALPIGINRSVICETHTTINTKYLGTKI